MKGALPAKTAECAKSAHTLPHHATHPATSRQPPRERARHSGRIPLLTHRMAGEDRPNGRNPYQTPPPSVDHVQPVTDKFSDRLPGEQLISATQLVHEYADIFSRSVFDFSRTDILLHRIDTGDAQPFKELLRRHPIAHLDFVDNTVKQMLRARVIEHCSCSWSSNMVLAKKSDGVDIGASEA